MKCFIALCFLVSSLAFAGGMAPLADGDKHISQASAEIVSTAELCPQVPGRMSCMAYGTVVTIKVTMNGCLDRLGGTLSKFTEVDGRGVLSFAALNIFNKASMTARCVRAPTELIKIEVPFKGDIELETLEYVGTSY